MKLLLLPSWLALGFAEVHEFGSSRTICVYVCVCVRYVSVACMYGTYAFVAMYVCE